ncbi:MAG: HlyD family secretion protein [Planctomycetota bacterium]|jgi:multidrug resistance efflux pump
MRKIFSNTFGRLNLHIMPVLIWLGAVACVVGLYQQQWQRFEIVGMAQGVASLVSPATTGVVKTVGVELFDRVSKDQTLAILDDELLGAQLAIAAAEIERLQAALNATHNQLTVDASRIETNWVASGRRFSVDAEQLRLNILQTQTIIETDRIMLQDLELDVEISKALLAKDAVTPYDLQKALAAYDAMAKKIEENQNLLAQYQDYLAQAEQRRTEFTQKQPVVASLDTALEPLRKAITVQEKQIEEISVRRAALVLKAPFDGMVSQIQARAGETVLAGATILAVTEAAPTEIIAYADEKQAGRLRENMQVELIKNTPPAQIAKAAKVAQVGPAIEAIPARLLRNPNIPQWGRPFLVSIPQGLELTPGEIIGIRGL